MKRRESKPEESASAALRPWCNAVSLAQEFKNAAQLLPVRATTAAHADDAIAMSLLDCPSRAGSGARAEKSTRSRILIEAIGGFYDSRQE
jgi:hypothetical protein